MITPDSVSIGLGVGTQPSLGRIEMLTRLARVLRFDAIWTVDHFQGFFPQAIWDRDFSWMANPDSSPHAYFDYQVLLGHLAAKAGRMNLAVGVTEPIRRHPVLLAQMAMTLSHVAKSPPIIGIGSGEAENVVPYGLDFTKPVGRLEDALAVIRTCLDSKGPFDHNGPVYTLSNAVMDLRPKSGNEPQLWIAAHGPRMLDLCGRYGDGWWPVLAYTPESYATSLSTVREAAIGAGRDPAAIIPGWSTFAVIGKTEREARSMLDSPPVKFLALLAPDYVWQQVGHTHPFGAGFGGMVDFIPQDHDKQSLKKALAAVPVDLVAESVTWGTPDVIFERLVSFVDAGLRHISMSPVSAMTSKRDAAYSMRAMISILRRLRKR